MEGTQKPSNCSGRCRRWVMCFFKIVPAPTSTLQVTGPSFFTIEPGIHLCVRVRSNHHNGSLKKILWQYIPVLVLFPTTLSGHHSTPAIKLHKIKMGTQFPAKEQLIWTYVGGHMYCRPVSQKELCKSTVNEHSTLISGCQRSFKVLNKLLGNTV